MKTVLHVFRTVLRLVPSIFWLYVVVTIVLTVATVFVAEKVLIVVRLLVKNFYPVHGNFVRIGVRDYNNELSVDVILSVTNSNRYAKNQVGQPYCRVAHIVFGRTLYEKLNHVHKKTTTI